MADERRAHLHDYARRYRTAARAGNWDGAKFQAILARRYANTDAETASALYGEGYARERLGDLRLAAACYEMAVRLAKHRKARVRLRRLTG